VATPYKTGKNREQSGENRKTPLHILAALRHFRPKTCPFHAFMSWRGFPPRPQALGRL
jgi:hypothetical protein